MWIAQSMGQLTLFKPILSVPLICLSARASIGIRLRALQKSAFDFTMFQRMKFMGLYL